MLIAHSYDVAERLLLELLDSPYLALDIETTGLQTRQDAVIGIGISNATKGFYYCTNKAETSDVAKFLRLLRPHKLITFNGGFDFSFLLNSYGIDLLPSMHCDVLLLKHACDENLPLDLKGIAANVFGLDATNEQQALKASIKANGGGANEFYKADLQILAKYCVQDCLLTYRLFEHYSPKLTANALDAFFYQDETMPLYKEVVIPMQRQGIRVDMDALDVALVNITKDLSDLETQIYQSISPELDLFKSSFLDKAFPLLTKTGKPSRWTLKYKSQEEAWNAQSPGQQMFNIASKHHLKRLFFDIMDLEPLSTTETGQPQVDEEFLSSRVQHQPWVQLLINWNKLSKIKGTYLQRFADECEDGIFYPQYKMHGTVSGRLSGDFQQLPRPLKGDGVVAKHTSVIRSLFVPRPGNMLISADYNSLEPTIFAHASGDKKLQAIFNNNRDFYSAVAIMTEGRTEFSSDKSAPNYLGNLDPDLRQKAKAYALGLAYGMTDYKLQFEIGVPQSDAAKLVKKYFDAFPDLKAWMDKSQLDACLLGKVRTQTGRVRHLGQAVALHAKYGIDLKDSLAIWSRFNATPALYKQAKEDRKVFTNLLNNAINFQVQGMAASVMNRASIALARALKAQNLDAQIVGQIHDQLLLEAPEEMAPLVAKITKECMESTVKISVPLKTTPIIGRNFQECK